MTFSFCLKVCRHVAEYDLAAITDVGFVGSVPGAWKQGDETTMTDWGHLALRARLREVGSRFSQCADVSNGVSVLVVCWGGGGAAIACVILPHLLLGGGYAVANQVADIYVPSTHGTTFGNTGWDGGAGRTDGCIGGTVYFHWIYGGERIQEMYGARFIRSDFARSFARVTRTPTLKSCSLLVHVLLHKPRPEAVS
jgi:hypothetical protein